MKNSIKYFSLILFATTCLSACKGGFSGEAKDSTMLDKHAMDSTADQNTKAGTLGQHSADSSVKKDTTIKPSPKH